MDSIGAGLFLGERVVFGMSLGRKNSLYGSFKGAPGTQFRGFHTAAQLHYLCKASNFGRLKLSCSSSVFGVLRLYGKTFESIIYPNIA